MLPSYKEHRDKTGARPEVLGRADGPPLLHQAGNESAQTSARFGGASRQIAQYERRRVESFLDVGDADVYADSEHGAAPSGRSHYSISGNQDGEGTQTKSETTTVDSGLRCPAWRVHGSLQTSAVTWQSSL